jgi:hypothetical protein
MKRELLIESWLAPAEDDHITVVDLYEASLQAIEYIEEIEAQNESLLEALEEIANMAVPVQKTEHRIARAAIAKAKGHTVRVNGGPQERHRCELHSESGGHGEAVEVCLEDEDGKLWVENGEYASVVYFCPVCGYASRAIAKGE